MQVEWSKAHARAQRFVEEEGIVLEEMMRVQRYFKWRSSWWHNFTKESGSDVVSMGKRAYALKQADMWPALSSKFVSIWQSELRGLGLSTDIIKVCL